MDYCENPSTRKPRKLLTRYPPAHATQSWNEGNGPSNRKDRINVNSKSFDTPCQRYTAMRRQMQRRFIGPDPTVPHLKYGIFRKDPNRVTNTETQDKKPYRPEPIEPHRREIKRPPRMGNANLNYNSLKTKISKLVSSDEAPLNSRSMKQLTLSASTHVDIKPRRFLFNMDKTILNNWQ